MTNTKKRPEVLVPAGTLEKLKVAVNYGADAVFVGGQAYGLRSRAGNFTMDELREGIEYAHARGVDVHKSVQPMHLASISTCLRKLLQPTWRPSISGKNMA